MTEPRYDVIVCDPPWAFESTSGTGSPRSVERQYPTMSTDEIVRLDPFVSQHAAAICRLFLWVPDSQLESGLRVMRAWGFRPVKAVFIWLKLSPRPLKQRELMRRWQRGIPTVALDGDTHHGLAFGSGRTTRNGAELCLLGARGRMDVADHAQRQVIVAPVREHSRKPDEAYERIEAMYPHARYLELFARHRRRRWSAWGQECPTNEGARA